MSLNFAVLLTPGKWPVQSHQSQKWISDTYNTSMLLPPWDSPDKSTGVGCHFLLQGIFLTRDWTQVSHIPGRRFNLWATREAPRVHITTYVSQNAANHLLYCILPGISPIGQKLQKHLAIRVSRKWRNTEKSVHQGMKQQHSKGVVWEILELDQMAHGGRYSEQVDCFIGFLANS